jgi:hypothetical protein
VGRRETAAASISASRLPPSAEAAPYCLDSSPITAEHHPGMPNEILVDLEFAVGRRRLSSPAKPVHWFDVLAARIVYLLSTSTPETRARTFASIIHNKKRLELAGSYRNIAERFGTMNLNFENHRLRLAMFS